MTPKEKTTSTVLDSKVSQVFIDSLVIGGAFFLSYLVRFDGLPRDPYLAQSLVILPYVVLLYAGMNWLWGVYSFIWQYTGLRETIVIALAVASSSAVLLLVRILFFEESPSYRIPFGITVIHPALAFVGLLAVRALRRIYPADRRPKQATGEAEIIPRRILIVGAGRAGRMLARELTNSRHFIVVGFLDDDPRKLHKVINGIRVVGTTGEVLPRAAEAGAGEVALAIPSASQSLARGIVSVCEAAGIRVSMIPSLSEVLIGKASIVELQRIHAEDLLGRDAITFPSEDADLLACYRGKRVLITGAGGSIGSELTRQMMRFSPERLILLDKDENCLYEIGLEISEFDGACIDQIVADVRDRRRIEQVFQRFQPEVVFHAAAYKQVPIMEANPSEAVTSNVLGTRNLIDLAVQHDAETFVLISTDKAVNPTSIMGASKRVAELILQNEARRQPRTHLCAVRFGNVLGSRGSVLQVFQQRISKGLNLQVTHPEMTRYFMTIPEAVHLVIQAGSLGAAGDLFILDMGRPVKIMDLAKQLIALSGRRIGQDIEIEISEQRPGEKLFEELRSERERELRSTKYPKIRVIENDFGYVSSLDSSVATLIAAAERADEDAICAIFDAMAIGFRLQNGQTDLAAEGG